MECAFGCGTACLLLLAFIRLPHKPSRTFLTILHTPSSQAFLRLPHKPSYTFLTSLHTPSSQAFIHIPYKPSYAFLTNLHTPSSQGVEITLSCAVLIAFLTSKCQQIYCLWSSLCTDLINYFFSTSVCSLNFACSQRLNFVYIWKREERK